MNCTFFLILILSRLYQTSHFENALKMARVISDLLHTHTQRNGSGCTALSLKFLPVMCLQKAKATLTWILRACADTHEHWAFRLISMTFTWTGS